MELWRQKANLTIIGNYTYAIILFVDANCNFEIDMKNGSAFGLRTLPFIFSKLLSEIKSEAVDVITYK